MRKIPAVLFTACAAFALGACNQQEQAKDQQAAQATPQVAPKPANPADKTAWKQYLVSVVTANMQGVKTNHPYMYFVPGGDDDAAKADRQNQLDNVKNVVARGVLPGNMMAFGGPDSKITSELLISGNGTCLYERLPFPCAAFHVVVRKRAVEAHANRTVRPIGSQAHVDTIRSAKIGRFGEQSHKLAQSKYGVGRINANLLRYAGLSC